MGPISIEKIRAMKKYNKSRRQQQLLPTLTLYMVATFVLCLLLTSPVWLPRLCSLLSFFLLTALPDLATAFLLSPKCLFVIGNLIVAFLVGESRLSPRSKPASLVTNAAVVVDHNALVGGVEEGEEEEEEEEELHKRVEDFIARVKKQRRLEAKSFFDTDR